MFLSSVEARREFVVVVRRTEFHESRHYINFVRRICFVGGNAYELRIICESRGTRSRVIYIAFERSEKIFFQSKQEYSA